MERYDMKGGEGKSVNVDVATSYGTVAPNHIGLKEVYGWTLVGP